MSAALSGRRARVLAVALLPVALAALPAEAQRPTGVDVADTAATATPAWLDRLDVSARYGTFLPTGRSELYALLDEALAPGARMLRPRLVGGELHLRMTDRWGLLLGTEGGGSTVASISRIGPDPASGDVRQRTSLALTSAQYVGAEWRAYQWRGRGGEVADQPRLVLRVAGGTARYRLHQWGEFVDVERRMAFRDDFVSARRGTFAYASAALEVPLNGWVALQGELRRQAGSAPMSADYAEFDRLDLGGTMFSVGVLVHPATLLDRR